MRFQGERFLSYNYRSYLLNQRFILSAVEQISTDLQGVCFVWFRTFYSAFGFITETCCACCNQSKHQKMLDSLTNQVAKPGDINRVEGRVV